MKDHEKLPSFRALFKGILCQGLMLAKNKNLFSNVKWTISWFSQSDNEIIFKAVAAVDFFYIYFILNDHLKVFLIYTNTCLTNADYQQCWTHVSVCNYRSVSVRQTDRHTLETTDYFCVSYSFSVHVYFRHQSYIINSFPHTASLQQTT